MGGEWRDGLDLSCLGEEQVVGSCKRGNEPSGPIKFGHFFD